MDIVIIASLIIAGLILFIIEVFLLPGVSIAGIVSAGCLLYANYYAFDALGTMPGCITLAISAIGVIAITIWFMRSKTVDKLSLKKTIDYRPEPLKGLDLKPGDEGVALTRLALIGNAEFNDASSKYVRLVISSTRKARFVWNASWMVSYW